MRLSELHLEVSAVLLTGEFSAGADVVPKGMIVRFKLVCAKPERRLARRYENLGA